MKTKPINRHEFLAAVGKLGAGSCLCAAAAGMHAAFAGQTSAAKPAQTPPPPAAPAPVQTKPGDKTIERAAKRMEFGDGWLTRFFEAMDKTLDEPCRARLMTANGRSCFAHFAGPAKEKPGPDALEKFKAWVADKGKTKGYSLEGGAISFAFESSAETGQPSPESLCLCPMAEAQERMFASAIDSDYQIGGVFDHSLF